LKAERPGSWEASTLESWEDRRLESKKAWKLGGWKAKG